MDKIYRNKADMLVNVFSDQENVEKEKAFDKILNAKRKNKRFEQTLLDQRRIILLDCHYPLNAKVIEAQLHNNVRENLGYLPADKCLLDNLTLDKAVAKIQALNILVRVLEDTIHIEGLSDEN